MDEDDAAPDPTAAEPDPALSYPRGNRLGLRHPRPTVVIVAAVLVALAIAFLWRTLQSETSRACSLTGGHGPVADDPDGAFAAWWNDGGAEASAGIASRGTAGKPGPVATAENFQEVAGDAWEWQFASDQMIRVEVVENRLGGPAGYRVSDVDICLVGPPHEVGPSREGQHTVRRPLVGARGPFVAPMHPFRRPPPVDTIPPWTSAASTPSTDG